MPAPQKTYNSDFYEVEPPVIPVKFTRPKGRGTPKAISMKGFEGFQLVGTGRGNYKVMKTGDFTLKILGDGYAEIPDTTYNRDKLKTLSKERIEPNTYNRPIIRDKANPENLFFRNAKGIVQKLDDKALEDGEIRIIGLGGTIPATVKPLQAKKDFDMKREAENCERVRPWLREFVKVDAAVMEAAPI